MWRIVSLVSGLVLSAPFLGAQPGRIALGQQIGRSTAGRPFPGPFVDPGFRAHLVQGTLPGATLNSRVHLDFADVDGLLFECGDTDYRIAYREIDTLKYGQIVGRNLLGKTRKHLVTIRYTDAVGVQHALVFRVDKGDVRPMLGGLEDRTGRRVEYQDQEARKSGT